MTWPETFVETTTKPTVDVRFWLFVNKKNVETYEKYIDNDQAPSGVVAISVLDNGVPIMVALN